MSKYLSIFLFGWFFFSEYAAAFVDPYTPLIYLRQMEQNKQCVEAAKERFMQLKDQLERKR